MITALTSAPIDKGPVALGDPNFPDIVVASLNLPNVAVGVIQNWVAFGKVVIQNRDSDDQNANATLFLNMDGHKTVLDRADFRLPGNGVAQSVSLQGAFHVHVARSPKVLQVDVACTFAPGASETLNGQAQQAQITAIAVDQWIPVA